MASYRYWKLTVPAGWYALSALQFYSDGRCTVKVNGTFTTDNATYGIVDMGSPVAVDSVCFAGGGVSTPPTLPFSILGSNDGVAYTPVFSSTIQMTGFSIITPVSIGAPNNGWPSYAMGNLTTAVPPLSAVVSLSTPYPSMYQLPSNYISSPILSGGYLVNSSPVYDLIPTKYQWECFNSSNVSAYWSDISGATSKNFPKDLVNSWPYPIHTGFQYRLKITQGSFTGVSNIISVAAFAVEGFITGPSTVVVGTPITLAADVWGGNLESWAYNWTGTDGASGTTSSLTKTYTTTGTKTVTCVVTSGGQSTTLTKTITVVQPPISATITATPTTGLVSQNFVFSVSGVSGGVTPGSYTYSWSGPDGLTGTGTSVSKVFSSAGTKTVTCTITSGGVSNVFTVDVTVTLPAITGSITANPATGNIGDNITYSVSGISGGSGIYTYAWSGSDSLTGTNSSVTKSYTTTGTKTATCVITSGSVSLTLNTSAEIGILPITGSIIADPISVVLGSPINFTMNATGGVGSFVYNWTGDESFTGTTQTVTKTFSTIGTKNVTCAVTSGGVTTNFTTQVTVMAVPTLVVSIAGNVSKQLPNVPVSFISTISGGVGGYTYSWSTTDGFTSTVANPSFTWTTLGAKTVTLTVTSGTQNVSASTTVTIMATLTPNLGRLCFVG